MVTFYRPNELPENKKTLGEHKPLPLGSTGFPNCSFSFFYSDHGDSFILKYYACLSDVFGKISSLQSCSSLLKNSNLNHF